MEQAVILSAVRTPIGKFMGGLAPLTAPELGAKAIARNMHRRGAERCQHFACFRSVSDQSVALDMGVSFFYEPYGCIP